MALDSTHSAIDGETLEVSPSFNSHFSFIHKKLPAMRPINPSPEIIGDSPAMRHVFDLIQRVAASNSNILITGESGTGKELVAKSIHNKSNRARKPFIAINCTAIPEELLESELFGHVKGSFTGAVSDKKGLFEDAHGGTLFLDEIGDMHINLQAKILRALQDRAIRPVGSNQSKSINVRIITATHRNLQKMIKNETFREDLYYRLAVIPIEVPPLRQRSEDIPSLVHHFLKKHSTLIDGREREITPSAIEKLSSMPWPGNVRQLENMMERLIVLAAPHSKIDIIHIPDSTQPLQENLCTQMAENLLTLKELERHYIQLILTKSGWKKEKAAQILGINRRTLYRKEQEYSLQNDSPPS